MSGNTTTGGHDFNFETGTCTRCKMTEEFYEDHVKPPCRGKASYRGDTDAGTVSDYQFSDLLDSRLRTCSGNLLDPPATPEQLENMAAHNCSVAAHHTILSPSLPPSIYRCQWRAPLNC
jgi:hypothetical protein